MSFLRQAEKQGTLKLEGWKPTKPPSKPECHDTIQLINEIVMSKWNQRKQAIMLLQIYLEYKTRVIDENGKPYAWWRWSIRGKRTIDRMVNRAADPRWYEDGVPKIVAKTAGEYQPNPMLFEKPLQKENQI